MFGGQGGRVYVVAADGKPQALNVLLGMTDGSMTEVVGGELKDGQEVIVGAASAQRPGGPPAAGPGGSQTPGPRLRL
jgi:HlyD family secretion protein